MKLRKKMIILQIVVLILLSNSMIGIKTVKAVTTYPIQKADLYSKGELCSFSYKGILVGVQFVVYKKDGIEYPAYCLNRNLVGVESGYNYSVKVEKVVTDARIWRTITNGYPYKSIQSLGCNTAKEAFAATKMAVYDAMYHYNWNDFKAENSEGERVIKAAEKIATIAKNSTQTKITSVVKVDCLDKTWQTEENNNYASKIYEVETNAESTKYKVDLISSLDGIKIVDEKNQEKKEFKNQEKFKILIPIKELEANGEIRIQVEADMKTKPILYGESSLATTQDYALAASEYEYEQISYKETYEKNKTKIEIVKQDKQTNKQLAGAKFNIYDKDKNLIYTDVITNEEGKIVIENILPGKYYIEEIKAPEGYTKYEELIEVEVKLNQTYTINIGNYEKPRPEEKEVENKQITVTGKKEKVLPRTGY